MDLTFLLVAFRINMGILAKIDVFVYHTSEESFLECAFFFFLICFFYMSFFSLWGRSWWLPGSKQLFSLLPFYFLFFIWCCTTINHPFLKRSICPSSITPNAFHWLMVNQLNWRVVQLINSHVMCIAFEKWDLSRRLTVLLSSCEIIYMLLVWLSFVFSAPSLSAC